MTTDALALENQLCFAVYSAAHAFNRFYKPRLAALGVTYPQYLVLLYLWEKGEARVTDIGAALDLDTGTLSPLLKRLEKTGYITRVRSSEDERQVLVTLTSLGHSKRPLAEPIPMEMGRVTGWTLEEAVALRNTLKTLTERLSTE